MLPDRPNEEPTDEISPLVIAAHEIGHLIVGMGTGRKLESVTIDGSAHRYAVKWQASETDNDLSDYSKILINLAGPRAQFEYQEESIPPSNRDDFRLRIVQPMNPREKNVMEFYNKFSWANDLHLIYSLLMSPDCPTNDYDLRIPFITIDRVIDKADANLKVFFSYPHIRSIVADCAEILVQRKTLTREEGTEIILKTGILESPQMSSLVKLPARSSFADRLD